MTTLSKRALLAATLATALTGMSAATLAQTSAPQPTATAAPTTITQTAPTAKPAAPTAEQRDQKRAEHLARWQQKKAERQAALKAELKLAPEQEPAWNAFIARTQPQARPARQDSREDWSKLTTPQRLDKMQALKAERDAAMAKRVDAIRSFYTSLNTDQQKVFDSKHLSGFQRAGMRHGHGHHQHHGGHPGMKNPV